MAVLDENGLSHLWSKIKEFCATKDHTHSEYENKNVFGIVRVGSSYITADSPRDTLSFFAGANITITPDADDNKLTIKAVNTQDTAGASNTSSKIFLVGATAQDSSRTTYSHDTVYVDTDGCLYSDSKKVATMDIFDDYAKKADITGVYKYKGSVANASSLPTDASVGDVYDIQSASVYGSAGSNVAWTGTAWDSLGEIFSVDSITNTQIDEICV